jgi:hypothetical protein
VLSPTRKETSYFLCQNGVNILRRQAVQEQELDIDSLDVVEIARVS